LGNAFSDKKALANTKNRKTMRPEKGKKAKTSPFLAKM
jgi:hypothetical protein